ncbi:MarR family winged helix-turn-helix transcriptional regulator [Streptomyces massasporeus]
MTDAGATAGGEPVGGARAADGDVPDGRSAEGHATAAGDPARSPAGEDRPDAGLHGEADPGDGRRGDTVAAVVRQWQAVRPGLDTGPMEIIGRINRCAALLQQAEDAPLRRAGLSRPEFDLLGALRRTGHELTPGDLARETFSSGAAVTKRLKQLTERGLVERRGDTRDRRVVHLRLTDTGRDLVDGILPVQLAYETAVLSGMDGPDQGELAALLGELLSQLEGRLGALRT